MDANSDMVDIWTTLTRHANKSLVNDIITALNNHPHRFFDIIGAIRTLEIRGIFSPSFCQELRQILTRLSRSSRCTSSPSSLSREKLQIFILKIFQKETTVQFCSILDLLDLSDLADDIHIEHNGPIQRQIRRATIPHSQELQDHFYELKHQIDNSDPTERLNLLWNNTNDLKALFLNNGNETELTKTANMFAVNTWLMVQHCRRDTQKIRHVLEDMRMISWPAGIDPILAMIIFESKMAVVSAMEGSFEFAKVHRLHAKILAREYDDPLTKALICHDGKYVSQALKRNNFEDSSSVLRECQNGLQFLESESNGHHFCTQMYRLFLLYIAQEHLHIKNDLRIDRRDLISRQDLNDASKILFAAKLSFSHGHDVEQRREMVYNVCMARLSDAQERRNDAKAYLEIADHLSNYGAFFDEEKRNIRQYRAELDRL